MNDQFGDWEEYLTTLERLDPAPAVLGITDYFSVDSYRIAKEYKDKGRLSANYLLIPNIEFRISPHTTRAKGINLHLLVSPADADHVSRIEESLTRLFMKHRGEQIACTRPGLERLGKIHNPNQTDRVGAYREGVGQYKIDFDPFRKWYENEGWLRKNSLIAVEAGSIDGTSGLRRDSGYAARRQEIESFADIIFSSRPADREFWLGHGAMDSETLHRTYGGVKPTIYGSDAHSIDAIAKARPLWIKADPTFEGLRQILYEPEDRIDHGKEAPRRYNEELVIESLSVEDRSGWFQTTQIPLNPGLVAVIGPRGSGKTALSDFVAFGAGAPVDPEASFLVRAADPLKDTRCQIKWQSGRVSEGTIRCPLQNPDSEGEVRYLSQRFVERLCSGDDDGRALTEEIERVIFQALPPSDQLGASSLAELKTLRITPLEEDRFRVSARMRDLNREIAQIDSAKADLPKHKAELKKIKEAITRTTRQRPKLKDTEETKRLEEFDKLKVAAAGVSEEITASKKRVLDIRALERKLKNLTDDLESSWLEISAAAETLGIEATIVDASRPVVDEKLAAVIAAEEKRALDHQKTLVGDASRPKAGTLNALQREIKKKEKELNIDKEKRRKIKELDKQLDELRKKERAINEAVDGIQNAVTKRKPELSKQRNQLYARFFALLEEEVEALEALYSPLHSRLASVPDAAEADLELYVQKVIDVDKWVRAGEELIDHRKSHQFSKEGALAAFAKEKLVPAWKTGDATSLTQAIKDLVEALQGGEDSAPLQEQLRSGRTRQDVADWVFSPDHISLRYGIRYEGLELEKLSPGTKGIVLLLLYLVLDTEDKRPLLIDQPEENLDNRSIFDVLLPYFRKAKVRRQIILITHNPNLVVNADAEQVIVANLLEHGPSRVRIRYQAGAIEAESTDPKIGESIREATIRILEGGKEAFEMREKRYSGKRRH